METEYAYENDYYEDYGLDDTKTPKEAQKAFRHAEFLKLKI